MFVRQLIANCRLYCEDCVNPPGCFSCCGLIRPSQGVARFAPAYKHAPLLSLSAVNSEIHVGTGPILEYVRTPRNQLTWPGCVEQSNSVSFKRVWLVTDQQVFGLWSLCVFLCAASGMLRIPPHPFVAMEVKLQLSYCIVTTFVHASSMQFVACWSVYQNENVGRILCHL